MRLWQLLIGICFVTPIGGALGPAIVAKVSTGGYILAAVVGIAVGALFTWMMWQMHKVAVEILLSRANGPEPLSDWYGLAVYISKILWIAVALLTAVWLTSLGLRLIA
jgi:hypothetical protein